MTTLFYFIARDHNYKVRSIKTSNMCGSSKGLRQERGFDGYGFDTATF